MDRVLDARRYMEGPRGRRRGDRADERTELLLRARVESRQQATRANHGRRGESRDRYHRRERWRRPEDRVASARRSRADVVARRQRDLLRERAQRWIQNL